jgi:hypothetical protein
LPQVRRNNRSKYLWQQIFRAPTRTCLTAHFPAEYIFVRFAGFEFLRSVGDNFRAQVQLREDHMRTMIMFFVVLLAIPVVQVAIGPRLERSGAPVVIDRSGEVMLAIGKHLRIREIVYPMGQRSEPHPKTS